LVTQEPATQVVISLKPAALPTGLSNFAWLRKTTPVTMEEKLMQSLLAGFAFPLNPEEQVDV
jgi:hypothetical protein